MPRKNLVNAVDAALGADVDAVVTSISVDDSTLLPPVPFYVVVNPFDDVNREYMECTAVTSNTLTVVRNLAGSVGGVAHPHLAGAIVRVAIMAQHIEDLWDVVEATPDLDDTYLRLDATNGPAVRHDVDVTRRGEVLYFPPGNLTSYLTTPYTPDMLYSDEIAYVAVLAKENWTTSETVMQRTPPDEVKLRLSGNAVNASYPNTGTDYNRSSLPLPAWLPNEIHEIAATGEDSSADGAKFYIDGVPHGTSSIGTFPLVPSTEEVWIGATKGTSSPISILKDSYLASVKVYDNVERTGTPIVEMDGTDTGLPLGPIADGTTFVSGGRTWTVVGANLQIAMFEELPTTSPVATLSDLDPLEARIAALENP